MGAKPETGRGWAWLMVTLAGVFPFASDMLRNFQLFAPTQMAWSFAAVLAATGGTYALARTILRGVEAALRRAGRPPGPRLRSVVFALAAALVFAGFLYDANMTELRVDFGLPRLAAASIVVALFAVYGAVAERLGAKRTCLLLLALLAFRSVRAGCEISGALLRGHALMSPEEIRVYQNVKLSRTPNVYFICLESYHDFGDMEVLYGLDNSAFRGFLETNGFAVAEGICANDWHTMSSLHSFFRMGHHYGSGTFGNHDSLHARGFLSGSGTYYNPVLNVLKRNGYAIVYLLPSDYYYRPGTGLVDVSLLDRSWPLAPLKVSLPRFVGREPITYVEDYERKLADVLSAWPGDRPAFFFAKLGAEHVPKHYDCRTDRAEFVEQYKKSVADGNPRIESLCRRIIAKDPGGIIVLAGDHGAQSYQSKERRFQDVMREDGIPAERIVRDLHGVLLAIRWGEGLSPEPYPFRSLANAMRFVLYRLSGDEALRKTAVHDSSYVLEMDGLLYQTTDDGRPLSEWKAVPRSPPERGPDDQGRRYSAPRTGRTSQ